MDFFYVAGFLVFVFLILGPIAFFMALNAQRRLDETNLRLSATRSQLEAAERRLQLLEERGITPPRTDAAPHVTPTVAPVPPPLPSAPLRTADQAPPDAAGDAADSPPKPPEVPPPPPPFLPATPPQPRARLKNRSARAGRSLSAALLWRSAPCCSSASPSNKAGSVPARGSVSALCWP